jgi:hypothetical protein
VLQKQKEDKYKEELQRQIQEKQRKKEEEKEKQRIEDEKEARRVEAQQLRIKAELEEEERKRREKEEIGRVANNQASQLAKNKKASQQQQQQANVDYVSPRKPASKPQRKFQPAVTANTDQEDSAFKQTDFRSDSPPLPAVAKKLGQQPAGGQKQAPPPPNFGQQAAASPQLQEQPNYYVTESKLNVASPVSFFVQDSNTLRNRTLERPSDSLEQATPFFGYLTIFEQSSFLIIGNFFYFFHHYLVYFNGSNLKA